MCTLLKQLNKSVVPILTAENAGTPTPSLPVSNISFHSSALVSTTHQCWALRLTGAFLDTIATLLDCLRECMVPGAHFWEAFDAVGIEDLVDIVSAGFILREGCDDGCRLKGINVLQGLAALTADAALWNTATKVRFWRERIVWNQYHILYYKK